MRDYNFNFKDKIDKICKDNDLTLNALAAKTGIPPTTVYRLAKGESEIPDLVTLGNLVCGFLSIIMAMNQDFHLAAIFMILSLIFDSKQFRTFYIVYPF